MNAFASTNPKKKKEKTKGGVCLLTTSLLMGDPFLLHLFSFQLSLFRRLITYDLGAHIKVCV